MSRRAFLLAWVCLSSSGGEAPDAFKAGVDAALQKRIDEAIVKGRASLEKFACEGDPKPVQTPETLRQRAKALSQSVEILRKQGEKLKDDRSAKGRQQLETLREQIRSIEKQAADDLAKAQDLELHPPAPAPVKPTKRELAPLADFTFGNGEQALIGLALVQAGMKPSDPLLQQVWDSLKAMRKQPPGSHDTYTLGISLMFVDGMMHAPSGEAWPPPERKAEVAAWVQSAAESLAAGCDGGAWTYKAGTYPVGGETKRYAVSGGNEIGSEALKKAVVPRGPCDYSNTQYAVLGLKAAALCGARIPEADRLWRRVLQQFLDGQEPDGKPVDLRVLGEKDSSAVDTSGRKPARAKARGWGYAILRAAAPSKDPKAPPVPRMPASATMTAAGLTALLVARSELKLETREKALVEAGVRDGLAWFQENLGESLGQNQTLNGYLFYGVERLGVLGKLQSLGDHAWYAEGAGTLVDSQTAEGSWPGSYTPAVNTAFCLLFLSRGTRSAYARSSYEVVDSPPSPSQGSNP